MRKQQPAPITSALRRRQFLSSTAAAGALATVGGTAASWQAVAKTLANDAASTAPRAPRRGSHSPANLTAQDFTALRGETFRLRGHHGAAGRARLIEVAEFTIKGPVQGRRDGFSLVFDVPRRVGGRDGHYRLSHPRFGEVELYLAPVDQPSRHSRLEAVVG